MGKELDDGPGEGCGVGLRHDAHVVAEQAPELDAARVVGRDDRRARGEGLDGHRGQRLELGRQHEQIGGILIAGHRAVVHEARQGELPGHAEFGGPREQFVAERPGAADHDARVGVRAQHLRHRVDEPPLARQRVQPLHVDEEVRLAQPELRAGRGRAASSRRGEVRRDRRVDDAEAVALQAELDGAVAEEAAVEGDVRRRPGTRA